MMSTITKLPSMAHQDQRLPLGDMLEALRRAWALRVDRRTHRPLRDIDGWSDQEDVAFYEGDGLSRG